MKIPKPKFFSSIVALAKGLEQQLNGRRYILLTDEVVSTYCLPFLGDWLAENPPVDVVEVEAGEQCKSIQVCTHLWEHLMEQKVDRSDVLICLGGGSVCDLGGFVAATYKRGMPCIYIPTTLLAMTDAAIGGKNGIDLGESKNMVGTIVLPEQTLIYPGFCETLPAVEVLSGMAEVFKHAIIGSSELWETLSGQRFASIHISTKLIRQSANVKLGFVQRDLFDHGDRLHLNFGHTIGHALESAFLKSGGHISHGIAVSMGMLVEMRLAVLKGVSENHESLSWQEVLEIQFGTAWPAWPAWTEIVEFIESDKKRTSSRWSLALPVRIGQALVVKDINLLDMQNAYMQIAAA